MATYWDTSALTKLYAEEPDSQDYQALADSQGDGIAVCQLHLIEMYYVLAVKEHRGILLHGEAGGLYAEFLQDIDAGHVRLIPWNQAVTDDSQRALDLALQASPPILLRSLDGIHLGATLADGITRIVTADIRMRQAARAAGLTVIVP